MRQYVLRRIAYSVVGLLLVSCLVFVMLQLAPGGPAILLGEQLSELERQEIARNLGLDQPVYVQFYRWLAALVRGHLGYSFTAGEPVKELIADRLPNTLLLALCALLFSCVVAVPVGIVAATRRYSVLDYSVTFLSFLGVSIPAFWLALLLIIVFSVNWKVLPSAGMYTIGVDPSLLDRVLHLIMPTVAMSIGPLAEIARYTRSSMIDVLGEDYVRTARAKGLGERVVLYRHALRNALIPVVTVVAAIVPALIGGSVIVEKIFAWPGMGRLAVDSAMTRDYPVVMGVVVTVSVMVITLNLLVDLLYGWLDPRVRVH